MEDSPGVVRVIASPEPAPDTLPISQVPIAVRVVMAGDASAAQIMDVIGAYADDEAFESIEVVLRGPERTTTLMIGPDIHPAEGTVDDLVAAQQDATIARYRRGLVRTTFWDGVRLVDSVDVRLRSGGLDDLIAAFDQYRSVEGIGPVLVRVGRLQLWVDEDVEITEAKRQLMRAVDEKFRLRRVSVGDPSGMVLWVNAPDLPLASIYVDAQSPYAVGRVSVEAHQQ